MVENDYSYLKIYAKKNESRWPVDSKLFYDKNNFEMELQLIKNWVPKQLDEVSNYMDTL